MPKNRLVRPATIITTTDLDALALALVSYERRNSTDGGENAGGEGENGSENTSEFVIPETLEGLTDDELRDLHAQAVAHFDDVYGDGQGLSDADLEALAALTEGIETLTGELDARAQAAREREETAAALAARAHPDANATGEGEDSAQAEGDDEDDADEAGGTTPPPAGGETSNTPVPVAVAASGNAVERREIRLNVGALRSRQAPNLPRPAHQAQTMRDVVLAAGEGSGYAAGAGVDWTDVGRIVDRRLAGYNEGQFVSAARSGQHLRQQYGVAVLRKPFDPSLVVESNDPLHVDEILRRAADESRLPGGSLVASGGWCAPSETLYDLCELESRDGLVSVPEVGISRGGISWTPGPDFTTIYNATGFDYTEAEDVAGAYVEGTPNTVGSKPCYKVPCPAFQEARLNTAGVCITAGLLQQRGYPEVIARTVRGALVAHDHKMSARVINALVAGSTPVSMTANPIVGTLAPLLTAIELQSEHYRYVQRMARRTTLEAIFPYWIRGAVRSDLAVRAGAPEATVEVTDAQIDGWFRSRGINPQFVYDWQPLTGAAGGFVTWPTTVQFLMFAAGTWVKGGADVITLDTLYDTQLLGTNDFTALFTEEGYLVAKLCHDSRVITAPVCPSGQTAAAVATDCDGSKAGAG